MLKQLIKDVTGQTPVKYFKFYRARLAETVGYNGFSYPALFGLDKLIAKKIPKRGGFFIEVGANDGFAQSNTYALERFSGWHGLLIEPIPQLYGLCRQFRPATDVVNCALGPALGGNYGATSHLVMEYSDLKSQVQGSPPTVGSATQFTVPVVTLSSLLDERGSPEVDLFSLDVEGFELQVLGGLDLARHRPGHILVETEQIEKVADRLGEYYGSPEPLSHHDFLFTRR